MDNITQNFLRMGAGAIAMVLVSLIFFRKEFFETLRSGRSVLVLMLFALTNVVGLLAVVKGLSMVPAVMNSLVAIIGIPLTLFIVAIFFNDEREIIKDKRFIVGMSIAILGTIGTAVTAGGDDKLEFSYGLLWLLLAVFTGAIATTILKYLVNKIHPVAVGTVFCLSCAIYLEILIYFYGSFKLMPEISYMSYTIAFLSGTMGILLGVGLYNFLIKEIGVAKFNIMGVAMPVITAIIAYFLIGDTLTIGQMICGGVILGGCALSFRKQSKPEVDEEEPKIEEPAVD
ncbi:MAG: DMT family transporter [Lentisphaeria bacterium]|nr:DMT family transporter [Lentisphaeria bacterium]